MSWPKLQTELWICRFFFNPLQFLKMLQVQLKMMMVPPWREKSHSKNIPPPQKKKCLAKMAKNRRNLMAWKIKIPWILAYFQGRTVSLGRAKTTKTTIYPRLDPTWGLLDPPVGPTHRVPPILPEARSVLECRRRKDNLGWSQNLPGPWRFQAHQNQTF